MTKEEMKTIIALEGSHYVELYKGCKIEIHRHPSLLHLNGYVSFPKGIVSEKCINSLLCHGGITYEQEEEGCKIIGFDTAHYGDLCPTLLFSPINRFFDVDGEYRDMKYCIRECKDIIEQVKTYNKREEAKRRDMARKIKQLEALMKDINESWEYLEDTEFIDNCYPFEKSFDEVVADVSDWVEDMEEKLEI